MCRQNGEKGGNMISIKKDLTKNIENVDLRYYFKEQASMSMGIYPMSSYNELGEKHERTPYEEGWNAALIKILEKEIQIESWFDSLSDINKEHVTYLLKYDVITLSPKKDKMDMYINCNDVFYSAADGEEITVNDFEILVDLDWGFGWKGIAAWIALKRGIEPMSDNYKNDKAYKEAKEYLKCKG